MIIEEVNSTFDYRSDHYSYILTFHFLVNREVEFVTQEIISYDYYISLDRSEKEKFKKSLRRRAWESVVEKAIKKELPEVPEEFSYMSKEDYAIYRKQFDTAD